MTNTTYTSELPTPLIPTMQDKVDKANRKAARNGLGEPFSMNVLRTFTVEKTILGQKITESWTQFEVSGDSPALPGWSYAAKVMWDDADAVVLNVAPFYTGPVLDRPTDRRCEHCNKIRSRKETHLVEGPDGTIKQVGTSCLTVYTGIQVGFVSLLESVSTNADDDWGLAGHGVPFFGVAGTLEVSIRLVDALGYVGKNGRGVTTRERFLVATRGARTRYDEQIKASTEAAMATRTRSSEDVAAEVAEILGWGETLVDADSDYLRNLHAVLTSDSVSERTLGYLLSAIPAFRREKGRIAERAAAAAERPEVVEGRREITGTIQTVRVQESQYGTQVKMRLVTDDGENLWGTLPASIRHAVAGDKVTLTATVAQSRDDKTFGFFSRPSGAAMAA